MININIFTRGGGDLGGNRTRDNLIKSQVLYRLSYQIIFDGKMTPTKNMYKQVIVNHYYFIIYQ